MFSGKMISATAVRVTPDVSIARVYLSVFPTDGSQKLVEEMNEHKQSIKHAIAKIVRHQLRKMPDLTFFLDDSLDYADKIDKLLK